MARQKVTRRRVRQSTQRQREAVRQRRQAQQNRIIAIAAAVLIVVVLSAVVVPSLGKGGSAPEGERPLAAMAPAERNNFYSAYPEMIIDTARSYEAVIQTDKGDMRLRLFDDEAPLTVNNFVFLARQGFYDGVVFHRVIENFMAQGGDPTGTGSGGPGYQFEDETDNGLVFDRSGLLAMANSGPDTNGSQFFITFVPTPHLNGAHTIFGELIEGQEVLNSLTFVEPTGLGELQGDVITRLDIVEE